MLQLTAAMSALTCYNVLLLFLYFSPNDSRKYAVKKNKDKT